ncbi:MAG: hypothetical protein JSV31_22020 [Desulfobacterales bacterium]|nr:MAG: hypothetical protein JSV31_22020 [Desulfobacterales bacterium]
MKRSSLSAGEAFDVGSTPDGLTIFSYHAAFFIYICWQWQEKYDSGKLTVIGAIISGSSFIRLGLAENIMAVFVRAFLSSSYPLFTPQNPTINTCKGRRIGYLQASCEERTDEFIFF